MGKQIYCFVLSVLIAAICCSNISSEKPNASSDVKQDWYKILHQLSLRNKRLQCDVEKWETRAKTCTGILKSHKKLTATHVNASIYTEEILKTYLDDANREMKKYIYNLLNSKCDKLLRSCAALKEACSTKSGMYKIDPDGNGGLAPFEVECLMDDDSGKVVTVFHHDSEARANAGPNCEERLSCVRNVTYHTPMPQITSIIQTSSECKQFIKYDCFGSLMFNNQKAQVQGWYSRNGELMDYWGGATPGSKKCSCGMTNSCADKEETCNCDKNDFVWRSDSGFLRDKATLPVSKMAFGDLGGVYRQYVEQGYYHLGPLKCYN